MWGGANTKFLSPIFIGMQLRYPLRLFSSLIFPFPFHFLPYFLFCPSSLFLPSFFPLSSLFLPPIFSMGYFLHVNYGWRKRIVSTAIENIAFPPELRFAGG
eukprot:Phypoly_transcript_24781.p1 GENE.Phypoly_transcript_24781~~Phypoly_transcript_24781.p1  ORF type:complete len:101 (+),score=15.72 Phypoly_transcript_24781:206-508(+)